jgi:antitoxin VapB
VTATAKLFMHGRSQAVRLPKEFRMPGKEVRVRKVGDTVVLEPVAEPIDVKAWRAKLESYYHIPFMEDGEPEDPPVQPDDSINFD